MRLPADKFRLKNGTVATIDPVSNREIILLLKTSSNRVEAFGWDTFTNEFQGGNISQDCINAVGEYKRRNELT